jgi:hypothetical protein
MTPRWCGMHELWPSRGGTLLTLWRPAADVMHYAGPAACWTGT